MNTKRETGGPAYPTSDGIATDGDKTIDYHSSFPGMSLRDWFAGQALTGLIASPDFIGPEGLFTGNGAPVMADAAYILADAMLAERSKP